MSYAPSTLSIGVISLTCEEDLRSKWSPSLSKGRRIMDLAPTTVCAHSTRSSPVGQLAATFWLRIWYHSPRTIHSALVHLLEQPWLHCRLVQCHTPLQGSILQTRKTHVRVSGFLHLPDYLGDSPEQSCF
ncbi:hypothetical protein WMY93_031907 [Mugilogobius chulae]|uniref:Uncharacterized protein n=1 Tax=Mugilogobius chulae TaxID=88201 RepID=A0AAW0MKV4_9GOBI